MAEKEAPASKRTKPGDDDAETRMWPVAIHQLGDDNEVITIVGELTFAQVHSLLLMTMSTPEERSEEVDNAGPASDALRSIYHYGRHPDTPDDLEERCIIYGKWRNVETDTVAGQMIYQFLWRL